MTRGKILILLLLSSLYCAAREPKAPHLLNAEIVYFDTIRQSMIELGFHDKNVIGKRHFMTGDIGNSHCYIRIKREGSDYAVAARIQLFGESSDSIYEVLYKEMKKQFAFDEHARKASGDTIFDYWGRRDNDRAYATAELYRVQEKTDKIGLRRHTTLVSCEVTNLDLYQTTTGEKIAVPKKSRNRELRLWFNLGVLVLLLLNGICSLFKKDSTE